MTQPQPDLDAKARSLFFIRRSSLHVVVMRHLINCIMSDLMSVMKVQNMIFCILNRFL